MKKVVIIGAGPAGLTAGYELLKDNSEYEVVILEAENQVGGISKTVRYKGNRMDIGGHRFFSKDDTVMEFWKDLVPLQGEPSYDDKKLDRQKPLEVGRTKP
jgi:protoporphyrinogen oxidase